MTNNDERTPLLSRSATSSYKTDYGPLNRDLGRRRTEPNKTKSFLSSARDSLVSTCQSVVDAILPPTPTEEELDEVLSTWSKSGTDEVSAQLTSAALDHFSGCTFLPPQPPSARPKGHLETRSEVSRPGHIKFRHLVKHIDRHQLLVPTTTSWASTSKTMKGHLDFDPTNERKTLMSRVGMLNSEHLAYQTQGASCYARMFKVRPPRWDDVKGLVDDAVEACHTRYPPPAVSEEDEAVSNPEISSLLHE